MNPDTWIPLAGMLTGVICVGSISVALVKIFHGPLGQGLGRKLQGKGAAADPELLNEVLDLRQQLELVQQRLTDAEERIDFSERLLARRSEAGREVGPA